MRRTIGFILCTIVLLQCATAFAVGNIADNNSTDVGAGIYAEVEKERYVLNYLGIVPTDESMDLNVSVTRADFAIYVAKMLKLDIGSDERFYSDVDMQHYAVDAINSLAKMNIINGAESGAFEPDRYITYEEACKILVTAAGYRPFVENSTLTGYVMMADTLDISILPSNSNELTLAEIIKMIYKTMSVNMANSIGTRNGQLVYAPNEHETIFSLYYNIYIKKGLVETVWDASLNDFRLREKQAVIIEGELYNYDNGTDTTGIFGHNVEFLYIKEKNESEKTIIYFEVLHSDETIVINGANIIGFDKERFAVDYFEDEKYHSKTSYNLSKGSRVVYNGRILKGSLSETINAFKDPKNKGSITIIPARGNNDDVVIIKCVKTYIMSGYDEQNRIIYDKYYNSALELKDCDVVEFKTPEGAETNAPSVFPTPIGVSLSEDSLIAEITVYDNAKDLTITEIYWDTREFYTDEGSYYIDSYALDNLDINLALNERYTIVFDSFGEAVMLTPLTNKSEIVFLRKAAIVCNGIDPECWLSLFMQDGTLKEFKIPSKIRIDESIYKAEDHIKLFNAFPGNNMVTENSVYIEPQVVRVFVNGNGDIYKIDTTNLGANEDPASTLRPGTNGFERLFHVAWSRKFDTKHVYSNATVMFKVPTLNSNGCIEINGVEYKDGQDFYGIGNKWLKETELLPAAVYYLGEDSGVAAAIAYRPGDAIEDNLTQVYMFDYSTAVYDEENGSGIKIYAWLNGNKVELRVADSCENDALKLNTGDLFRVHLNNNGNLVYKIVRVYNFKNKTYENQRTTQWNSEIKTQWWFSDSYGVASWKETRGQLMKVYPYNLDDVYLRSGYSMENTRHNVIDDVTDISKLPITVCDMDTELYKKNIRKGTLADIKCYKESDEKCSMVILNSNSGTYSQIFVYNNISK